MERNEIIKICKALNNPEKVRIISLIVREGEQSITDIKNKLRLSFSTTHKYLSELEEAGLLTSVKLVSAGREKRLYRVKGFDIRLAPDTFASERVTAKKKTFPVIDLEGRIKQFDPTMIERICMESGIPTRTVKVLLHKLSKRFYAGMPLAELGDILYRLLDAELTGIERTRRALEGSELFARKESFISILQREGLTDAVKSYMQGDFQIRNLGKTYPISFQHDFYLILRYGLQIIGIDTSPARFMLSAISHLETAIKAVGENLAGLQQGIDSLNILLAPFAEKISYAETKQHVQRVFYSLDQLNKIYGIQPSISLELSMPKYLAKKPALVGGKEIGVYQEFQDASDKLTRAFVEIAIESNLPYPKLFFKIRKNSEFPEGFEKILNHVYIQNQIPRWQSENATYLIDWSRIGPEWKGVKRSAGVPVMQMTTLNLPRLASEAKDEEQFFSKMETLIEMVKKVNLVSIQQIVGKSYPELNFLNKKVRDDKYCHLDDGIVLLGVLGMRNAVEHLAGSYEINMVKKILRFLSKEFKYDGIRTGIFEVDFSPILRRFSKLDELRFGKREKYWGGVNTDLPDDEKIELMGKLQPLLLGGHLCQLKKMGFEKIDLILKHGVGLAGTEKGIYKI